MIALVASLTFTSFLSSILLLHLITVTWVTTSCEVGLPNALQLNVDFKVSPSHFTLLTSLNRTIAQSTTIGKMSIPARTRNPEAASFVSSTNLKNVSTQPPNPRSEVTSLVAGITSSNPSTPSAGRKGEAALPTPSITPSSKSTSARRFPNPEAPPFIPPFISQLQSSSHKPTSTSSLTQSPLLIEIDGKPLQETSAPTSGLASTTHGRTLVDLSYLPVSTLVPPLIPNTGAAIKSTATRSASPRPALSPQAQSFVPASQNSLTSYLPVAGSAPDNWLATSTTENNLSFRTPLQTAHNPNFISNPLDPDMLKGMRSWDGDDIIDRLESLKIQLYQTERGVRDIQSWKQKSAGASINPSYSGAVKIQDRMFDLERAVLHAATAISDVGGRYGSLVSSKEITYGKQAIEAIKERNTQLANEVASAMINDTFETIDDRTIDMANGVASKIIKDTIEMVHQRTAEIASQVALTLVQDAIKSIVETVVEIVLDRVDGMQKVEIARLQECNDRYSRSNRILRNQLRFKSARVKENTRGESSGPDVPVINRSNIVQSVLRNPAVDVASGICVDSNGNHPPLKSSTPIVEIRTVVDMVRGKTSGSNDEHSAFDLGFLDSLDGIGVPDMAYLCHFMAPTQFEGAETGALKDMLSDSDGDIVNRFSKSAFISSSPPNVIKTGLDISRGTLSAPPTPTKAGPNIVAQPTRGIPPVKPWNGRIRWAEPGALDASELKELRKREVQILERTRSDRTSRLQGMFVYGIRYEPPINVSNLRRTVVVTNLPIKIQPGTLLRQVRGGMVLSISVMDTISIMGNASALVTFVQERSAAMFVNRATVKPLFYGEKRASVKLVSTPTWPMSKEVEHGILERGYTRVVVVVDCNSPVVEEGLLKDVMALSTLDSVATVASKNGHFEMSFTSVIAAKEAYEFITSSPVYCEYEVKFGDDPCAENRGWW